jgi:hypothetical protein
MKTGLLSALICVYLRQQPETWAADQRRLTQIKTKTNSTGPRHELAANRVSGSPQHLEASPCFSTGSYLRLSAA